jgi:hypothetical protein
LVAPTEVLVILTGEPKQTVSGTKNPASEVAVKLLEILSGVSRVCASDTQVIKTSVQKVNIIRISS